MPHAVRYPSNGKPEDVLEVASVDVTDPGPGEIQLELVAASINPSDLGMIAGTYGRKRELPAIGGREGVGRVVAVGAGVDASLLGRVGVMDGDAGTWVERQNREVGDTYMIPAGVDPEQAAVGLINPPTAWRLLHDFGDLKPGDWIVQNAGNSAVGQAVIALSRHFGYKTISEVRNPDWIEPLQEAGANHVVLADDDWHKRIAELTGGGRVGLAINSVGGMSVVRLIRSLSPGGSCVTIGGMVGDAIRYPTRELIFNDINLRGFWLDRWGRVHGRSQLWSLYDAVFNLFATGEMKIAIGRRFPLTEGPAAVIEAAAYGTQGKILIVGPSAAADTDA